MRFDQAYLQLMAGKAIKLPDWTGYWFLGYNAYGDPKILVFTKEGRILDTPDAQYILQATWQAFDVEDLVSKNMETRRGE